jgi:hypothetical protein
MEHAMASSNGVNHVNGTPKATTDPPGQRAPRRLVLLTADEQSASGEVLLELRGEEISGKRLHSEIQKLAAEHPGRWVAAEWLGKLGWTRFLWCRK